MIPDKTEIVVNRHKLLERLICKYKGVCGCKFTNEIYCDSLKHLKCTEYQVMRLTESIEKKESKIERMNENFNKKRISQIIAKERF